MLSKWLAYDGKTIYTQYTIIYYYKFSSTCVYILSHSNFQIFGFSKYLDKKQLKNKFPAISYNI